MPLSLDVVKSPDVNATTSIHVRLILPVWVMTLNRLLCVMWSNPAVWKRPFAAAAHLERSTQCVCEHQNLVQAPALRHCLWQTGTGGLQLPPPAAVSGVGCRSLTSAARAYSSLHTVLGCRELPQGLQSWQLSLASELELHWNPPSSAPALRTGQFCCCSEPGTDCDTPHTNTAHWDTGEHKSGGKIK